MGIILQLHDDPGAPMQPRQLADCITARAIGDFFPWTHVHLEWNISNFPPEEIPCWP